ncbi:unnamed protein product [Cylicostephanus goldi]|uniref:Uncharacterized protein n=1 Tax=Cylicostephanus goldi TaxID=71465 RepID=A0A3P6UBI0_CYLGO|nr:unnamed protein product [Cylicostephanus goldi]
MCAAGWTTTANWSHTDGYHDSGKVRRHTSLQRLENMGETRPRQSAHLLRSFC